MKIKALANIDNSIIPCTGEIEIHWIKEPQAYVTWKLFSDKSLIASKSKNYFFEKDIDTHNSLIKRVIEEIKNYRIGRKKVFEKVERGD